MGQQELEEKKKKAEEAFKRAMDKLDALKKKYDEVVRQHNQKREQERIIELRNQLNNETN